MQFFDEIYLLFRKYILIRHQKVVDFLIKPC